MVQPKLLLTVLPYFWLLGAARAKAQVRVREVRVRDCLSPASRLSHFPDAASAANTVRPHSLYFFVTS